MTLEGVLKKQIDEMTNKKDIIFFYTGDLPTLALNCEDFISIENFVNKYELAGTDIYNSTGTIPHVRKKV